MGTQAHKLIYTISQEQTQKAADNIFLIYNKL